MEDILREAELMTDNGVKEISLIAQDTTSYGQDLYGTPQLVQLLRNLLQNRRIKRLRIMYAYPHRVSKELADLIDKDATEDEVVSEEVSPAVVESENVSEESDIMADLPDDLDIPDLSNLDEMMKLAGL